MEYRYNPVDTGAQLSLVARSIELSYILPFVSHLKGIGDGLLVSLRKSREMKGLTGIYSLIFVVKTRLEIAHHQSPCLSHLFISK